MKTVYVVLNDGETFSVLDGCSLVTIDEDRLTSDELETLNNGDIKYLMADAGSRNSSTVDVQDLSDMLNK